MPGMGAPSPWWDFPRGVAGARIIAGVGAEHGLTAGRCLRGTGLTPGDLDDADAVVDAGDEIRIVRNVLAGVPTEVRGDGSWLGAAAGARYTLGQAGVLGFALIASPTLGDAMRIGMRHLGASNAFVRVGLNAGGAEVRVTFDDSDIDEDVRPFLVARDLMAILQVLTHVTAGSTSHGRLELRLPRVPAIETAAAGLVDRIEFGRPRNVTVLPAEFLARPLPQADARTAEVCARHCSDLVEQRRLRRGTSGAVRAALLRDPARPPSMRGVAGELGVSERTLRSRLEFERTSFRVIRDEVREALALDMLGTSALSVEEVARRLGYAETASFTRAFTRWRGAPPSRHR
ncbi:AraC family transcriptional regulator [Rhodococcus daqingensis]|uniref:AraC family transcriptional regulator ligand-binding domain-containing protein n=1 Tax=Rhodococcus daqingensis TaxID=2479363 RepID=A0ABW2RRL1_9NOCA